MEINFFGFRETGRHHLAVGPGAIWGGHEWETLSGNWRSAQTLCWLMGLEPVLKRSVDPGLPTCACGTESLHNLG